MNVVVQLFFIALFLMVFGIPSIQKYLDKGTIVVSSEEETDGIEAPAITVFALKDTGIGKMDLGWKTSSDATSLWTFNMVDHCTKIGLPNLATCVSNDTFELSDYLKEAHSGLFRPASKFFSHDSLWTEDMTFTFTLRLSQIMTRDDSDAIVFSLNTSQSFSYSFLLHDEDFFLLSINPYSLPTKSWRFEAYLCI